MASALDLFSRFADDLEARADMNPDRWDDLLPIVEDIRWMVKNALEDDE